MRRCEDSAPEELLQAIQEFNDRQWFECHETLEDLWVAEEGELRQFYQGLIKVAAALHHWRNNNFVGALSMLKGGAEHLIRVSECCQGVNVSDLIAASDRLRLALEELGKEHMEELDPDLIPLLRIAPVKQE